MSYDWKNILIKPDQPIRDALQLIDSESLRIALVVDDQFSLLGVVTDGDVRRGLLKNLSINSPVYMVMNTKPLTAKLGTARKELVKFMEKEQLLAIPLMDGNKVAGLETLQRVGQHSKYQNPVFIMAGGFGTRLRPLTDNCPKPMLKVGDKPILEIVLNSFINAGFVNFYISTHYLPEMIRDYFGDGSKWNVKINYVHEEEPLGTGGALGLLPSDTPDLPLILINGDVLTNVDFERVLEFHNKHDAAATMCVRDYEYQVPFGVIQGEGNKITSMVEKPVQRFFVNAGIYIVSPKIRSFVRQNFRIDMPTLLEQSISQQQNVLMFPIHEYWLDIGRIEDYNRAQTDIMNLEF
ncbi:nucleotidyltransferase family protein [Shewanella xiamenensis]|uniref:nucleotidyltransferase family protein n=1 Tax=Shewanella xiamenensis TaxID=332186 RepID=UPI002E7AFAD1|nr:nucleotidyltransferase family protein [Shewanella xiamenensis]MEE1979634.1 nucleotidyltransferase family protein [Shewanella xiamenensis]